jgi:hypothetical protein
MDDVWKDEACDGIWRREKDSSDDEDSGMAMDR